MNRSKRKRRKELFQMYREAPILKPSGLPSGSTIAAKHIYYLCNPVQKVYYDLQVRGTYDMECRFNKVKGTGYMPQMVSTVGGKMIRLQNSYNHKLPGYRTAVYMIKHSRYTGKNPAIKYGKHLPEEVKSFLLGDYGTKHKPKSQGKAWTIFMLGDLLYEGSKAGFDEWYERLGTCSMEAVDEDEE